MTAMTTMDTLAFFRAWVSNPLRIAAIAPSGAALADLITSELSADSGPVLELGPGTGAFTRALLARGVRERDLILIEHSADFAGLLRHRFPAARVQHMDAARLDAADHLFEAAAVGGVVSGLPLLSMTPRKVMTIVAGAFGRLHPRGAFYQFTYGLYCPVPRRVLDRSASRRHASAERCATFHLLLSIEFLVGRSSRFRCVIPCRCRKRRSNRVACGYRIEVRIRRGSCSCRGVPC